MLRWNINKLNMLYVFLFAITSSINIQKPDIFVDCIIYVFWSKKKSRSTYDVCQVAVSHSLSCHTLILLDRRLKMVTMKDITFHSPKKRRQKFDALKFKNLKKLRGSSNHQLFLWLAVLARLCFVVFAKIKAIDHLESDEFEFVQQPWWHQKEKKSCT